MYDIIFESILYTSAEKFHAGSFLQVFLFLHVNRRRTRWWWDQIRLNHAKISLDNYNYNGKM